MFDHEGYEENRKLQTDLKAAQAENARLREVLNFCKNTSGFALNNPPDKTSPMRALWEIYGQIDHALQPTPEVSHE